MLARWKMPVERSNATPARRAMSSSDVSTPASAKTAAATSTSFSRLRRASARSGGGVDCAVFGGAEAKISSKRIPDLTATGKSLD